MWFIIIVATGLKQVSKYVNNFYDQEYSDIRTKSENEKKYTKQETV